MAAKTVVGAVCIGKQRGYKAGLANLYSLFEKGADPNATDSARGVAPLHHAAEISDATTATKFIGALLEEGADVDAKDHRGRTPLLTASKWNPNAEAAAAVVRALLDAGADVKAVDKYGRTALHRATQNRSAAAATELVPLLVDKGADVNAKTGAGATPLHAAAGRTESPAAAAAGVQALLAAGADVNSRDSAEDTPLHHATCNSNAEAATAAIGALAAAPGVNLNATNKRGRTPLHVAARFSKPAAAAAAARALLAAGANPHICDSDGVSPLVAASCREDFSNCSELVQVLAGWASGSTGTGPSGSSAADPSQLLDLAASCAHPLPKHQAPAAPAPRPGECVVCLDALASMIFMQCGHMIICEACASRVDGCPVCSQPGAARKVFM